MLRFLFDECLTPDLVAVAANCGHAGEHVVYRGWAGYPDHALAALAVREDAVFVTNNGSDYRPIYRSMEIHPGLIVILPSVPHDEQEELFVHVLRRLEGERDLVNKLAEVTASGEITITDFPPFRDNI